MYNFEDYYKLRIWYLTPVGRDKSTSKWIFQCDCGQRIIEYPSKVIPGYVRSCGCMRNNRLNNLGAGNKFGKSKSPYYNTWKSMMHRCYDPNHNSYKNYGAKGIYVCEEWHNAFNFYKWAQATRGADNQLTLDRVDNRLPYCPENCRWATRLEQTLNRSNTVVWQINGVSKPLSVWCKIYDADYNLALIRHKKLGWPLLKCLTEPKQK